MEDFKDLYIQREDEHKEIQHGLKKFGNVVLLGKAGSGKTMLAKQYITYSDHKYDDVFTYSGHQLEIQKTNLELFLTGKKKNRNSLIIIDGFEEIKSKPIHRGIFSLLQEGKKYGYHIIIVSRPFFNTNPVFNKNVYVIHLQPFSVTQTNELIDKLAINNNINLSTLKEFSKNFDGNPFAIKSAINLFKRKNYTKEEFKKLLFDTQINYKNEFIEHLSSTPSIQLLDVPEIIKDVKLINSNILQKINRNPNEIHLLEPRQFEELVAELLQERGYNVTLTKQTRDGGKDLMIVKKDIVGDFLIYAECKKWAPHRAVGVNVVSDLVGRMYANRATAGMVITSSYFSPDAKTFTKTFRHQMNLIDFVDLSKLIQNPPIQ